MERTIQLKTSIQFLIGVLAAIALIALTEIVRAGGFVLMVTVALATFMAILWRARLPVFLKVFSTTISLYFGWGMSLDGRTVEPGLNPHNLGMALTLFTFGAGGPIVAALLFWPPRVAWTLVLLAPLVCVGGALAVAEYEEHSFVRRYQETGVGPTARWTVSSHWLSYDRETQQLRGSD